MLYDGMGVWPAGVPAWRVTRFSLVSFLCQVALGYGKHYNRQNPFDWMELISLQ